MRRNESLIAFVFIYRGIKIIQFIRHKEPILSNIHLPDGKCSPDGQQVVSIDAKFGHCAFTVQPR